MDIFTFCQSDKDQCELNTVEVAQCTKMADDKGECNYSAAYANRIVGQSRNFEGVCNIVHSIQRWNTEESSVKMTI